MTTEENAHVRKLQEREEKRREDAPSRDGSQGSDWSGEPAEDAERRRGTGRGLDEPEKDTPPDALD
ncbi:MAG: hypothetical protein RLO52_10915 [Sandaracinaceae bacterium]|nr:MAG: hypothetical protein EVA89_38410 [Sandaracinaceae bacterium]HBQ15093.1 hypothetical protein [Myxococcales bacterium]